MSNGAGPYSSSNAVFLDEYTPAGAYVRSHALPTTGMGAIYQNYSPEEGYLTRSTNGQYLTLVGYTVLAGSGSGFNGSTSVANPRAIGLVKYDGTSSTIIPPVTTPVATGTGAYTAGTSPTHSTLIMNSITSGTIAVGQYVYGTEINTGATVQSISGTAPNLTITLSNSGGTTNASNLNYIFMAAATPNYANVVSPGCAVTTNGTDFWLCSRESSIMYYNSTTSALSVIASGYTSTTARTLGIYDGQLYGSNDYGFKLMTIGTTPLPTAVTATAALQYATSPNSFAPATPKGFVMVDASTTVAGSDVLYAIQPASGGGGGSTASNAIVKYCKINGVWQVNGGYGAYTDNYMSVTATVSGGQVTLYAIRKAGAQGPGGELVKIVDAGGYSSAFSGTETIIAAYNTGTSPLGGAWRGIAIAPDNSSLPLNLLSFTGKQAGKAIELDWTTANEINVSGFDIERSADGSSFQKIGNTAATGNGGYAFTDEQPLAGTNYYRLKMIDKDGTYTYSNVVAISIRSVAAFNLYPNPANDQVTITHDKITSEAIITIYSMDGKKILAEQLATGNTVDKINVGRLAPGNYIVSLNLNNTINTTELIKK
ncbi:hypothetical protein F5148DRAFT_1294105 [Russula earlei]|uniref:Uncharacterized protein n=1 Tax=Russula earlei TaxID=71964 RepID=A0ACC0TSV9_9AGAM|nr:hypothetical protein F5148DRAFT_1294105 [Russula earlei]